MSGLDELKSTVAALAHRVGTPEDVNAIRKLHYAYGDYMDFRPYDEVVQPFAEDGVVVFLSGLYKGHQGIGRLYKTWFRNFFTQGRAGPEYGWPHRSDVPMHFAHPAMAQRMK